MLLSILHHMCEINEAALHAQSGGGGLDASANGPANAYILPWPFWIEYCVPLSFRPALSVLGEFHNVYLTTTAVWRAGGMVYSHYPPWVKLLVGASLWRSTWMRHQRQQRISIFCEPALRAETSQEGHPTSSKAPSAAA